MYSEESLRKQTLLMTTIHILPQTLINQIAAGEVIERPASVVKELVENALDADSTQIDVTVKGGGQNYLRVQDNGIGMSPEDLELSIQRHATSKLTGKNLLDIHTFGFRGEALPSIGSVSRMEIVSRKRDSMLGWTLSIENGLLLKSEPQAAEIGTSVTLRDLFFSTPARLKFLKTTSVELAACSQQLRLLALANPYTGMSLRGQQKTLFSFAAMKNTLPSQEALDRRVRDVLGEEFHKNSLEVQAEDDRISCWGRLGFPTYHGRAGQYLFVNRRAIHDKHLLMAAKIAYQDVLIPGEQPSFVLFLTVPPHEVDMNVHPAKTEVRFRRPSLIRSFVIHTLRKTLEGAQKTPSPLSARLVQNFKIEPEGAQKSDETDRPLDTSPVLQQREVGSLFGFSEETTRPIQKGTPLETVARKLLNPEEAPQVQLDFSDWTPASENEETLEPITVSSFNQQQKATLGEIKEPEEARDSLQLGEAKAQIFNSFILSEKEDEMFIIDQHAAHERIVYESIEKYISIDSEGRVISTWPKQHLLFPLEISLNTIERLNVEPLSQALQDLGFDNQPSETSGLKILSQPQIGKEMDLESFLEEFIVQIGQESTPESLLKKIHQLFATYACHRSVRANHPLSIEEMNALLRQMEKTKRVGQCNHGRPTFIHLSRKTLERLFERKR